MAQITPDPLGDKIFPNYLRKPVYDLIYDVTSLSFQTSAGIVFQKDSALDSVSV